MLLFGLLLLSTSIWVQSNGFFQEEVTDRFVKVFIEAGKVKSLEPRDDNETLAFGWYAVRTKHSRFFMESYALLDIIDMNITGFEDGWYRLENTAFDMLSLAKNKIVEITSGMVNDLPQGLGRVYLYDNKIERLRNGVINSPHLNSLDLASNSIREIESGALSNLPRLIFLNLQDNQLHDTEFAATLSPNLEMLYLAGNAIMEISTDSFSNLGKLRHLSLSGNKITVIQQQAFHGLRNVGTLDLSDNPIERVESGSFESTPLLKKIKLSGSEQMNLTDVELLQLPFENQIFVITSR